MSKYIFHAANEAEVLRSSLSEDDREQLRADLEQLGFDAWITWAFDNEDEANKYLRATEKQRQQRKKWQEPVLRRRLTLSAYHQARLAAAMLEAAEVIGPGGGYRDTTALAASQFYRVFSAGAWRWPFCEPDPPPEWSGPQENHWVSETRIIGLPEEKQPPTIYGCDYT